MAIRRLAYAMFDTAIGLCAIAWTEPAAPDGCNPIALFQLPGASAASTEARIAAKCGARASSRPPNHVAELIEKVRKHLTGQLQDFHDVAIDWTGVDPFSRQVYELARTIRPGHTSTYGEIARQLGQPGASRAVGRALANNPVPFLVPCHRVAAAGGKPGGFSAHGGRKTKARMLLIEGVTPVQLEL